MIGRRIKAKADRTWAAVLLAVVLALGVVAAVIASPHPAIAAVLPLAVGLALLLMKSEPFAADMTETGLELHHPPRVVPYAAIEGLTVAGDPDQRRAPLYVFYRAGVVVIPARLTVPTYELFEFLAGRLSKGGSRDVPAPLLGYLRRQTETFGEGKVYSYCSRPHLSLNPRKRHVAACVAGLATGLVWIIAGIMGGVAFLPWAVPGGMLTVFCGLAGLAFRAHAGQPPRIRIVSQCGLVVSPVGLALVQGDTLGEMRWGELRNLEYRHSPRSFGLESRGLWADNAGPERGIHLIVEGARIVIADIYDRPLPLIYDRIRTYWRGPDANA